MPPPPKKSAGPPKAKAAAPKTGKSTSTQEAPSANMEFPKSDGDGHKDEADPALIERVLAEPDTGNMNICVVVRVN